jgi:elongation factor Ts
MAITAAAVKELRERTGSGMMECKKALVETDGDMDAAIEVLRKAGFAKADKKAGRVASEGLIVIEVSPDGKRAAVVEVNSETDFVAKKEEFEAFATAVAKRVLADSPASVDALLQLPLNDGEATTIDDARKELIAKLGENMAVRRYEIVETSGRLGIYRHGTRIGVVVDLEGGDDALAKDVAMHIAASKPICVGDADVPQDLLAKEKAILIAQAETSGKPADIIEKMVQGRLQKYLAEVTLLGQAFVKDPDITVGRLLADAGASVNRFMRLELGEGIEKKAENFAEEVMAQVRGE